ncbi:TetR/AcrR family transcriptional regulator [Thaumasiovibrio subtropicus]|uniref:TetR/AcrR family transcriptional regulator n=1 Tax=Thaumasiovibrio subtropicus TaxID=1891207 RepID=UPI000B3533C3|nr:TetR/AcrR family transcriptional regulator [Thaumasiovibrio subtropicus]
MAKVLKRSQRRLLSAFRELLTQKEYYEITVAEIISLADVGKTTFYRHYERKLDLFIEMHRGVFDTMLQDLQCREDWLSEAPRPMLVALAMKAVGNTAGRLSIAYKLGSDWPHAERRMGESLTATINARLCMAFTDAKWAISVAEVSSALAALYMDFLIQLNSAPNQKVAERRARNLQCFSRALVLAALEDTPNEVV